MGSYNSIQLIGHLGRDAELKEFSNGGGLVKFPLATTDVWKDKVGKKYERTDWHLVEMNADHSRNLLPYLTRGKLVLVEGDLRYDEWEKAGEKKRAAKVRARKIVLLSPSGKTGARAEDHTGEQQPAPAPFQATDDDVPF